ncbi:concanavalin A-like lectin/glucanase domain-containing protein [Lipomyces oligophaga]|uniref:concanavalin A-like lectin/glucanase domain-containing protein n=1 Tax=Lipomyces oligophaga TaxID=45792 RepID=UPI0034CEA14E
MESTFKSLVSQQQDEDIVLPSYLANTAYAEHLANAAANSASQLQQQSPGSTTSSANTINSITSHVDHDQKFSANVYSNHSSFGSASGCQTPAVSAASSVDPSSTTASSSYPPSSLLTHRPAPLPSCWSPVGISQTLELRSSNTEVRFTSSIGGPGTEQDTAAAVRTDNPIPLECGLFYFEIEIISSGRNGFISIGFSGPKVALNKLPGYVPDSWGYHGDDGNSYTSQSSGRPYGPQFTTLDIIGCGIDFHTNSAFYTKNGLPLGVAFRNISFTSPIRPSVGLRSHDAHVRANFGQKPFAFDVDAYMRDQKAAVYNQINSYTIPMSVELFRSLSVNEAALGRTIHQLITSYLNHNGYISTALAYTEDVQRESAPLANSSAAVDIELIKQDPDAGKRQKIRAAVLDGNIDHALKLTDLYFPGLFKTNERILFELECRKFLELMRSYALALSHEASADEEDSHMEDADDADDGDDNDGESLERPIPVSSGDLLVELLSYGQYLRERYYSQSWPCDDTMLSSASSPSASSALSSTIHAESVLRDIFALMAYSDPLNSSIAHLLSESGRSIVAEDLNSSILVSQGKSRVAPLEYLTRHLTVLVHELAQQQDGGMAAFINVRNDFLSQ